MDPASLILLACAAYATVGVVLGVFFVAAGIGAVDRGAVGSPWAFRLLILPGAAALWPAMLLKWVHARRAARASQAEGQAP